MLSSSSLCKNKEVLAGMVGKIEPASLSCRQYVALGHGTCLHSCGVGDISSHSLFAFVVWVISFDLSSALCLVVMTSDILMSNTAKSNVVTPICSREVDLCSSQPSSDSLLILIHKHYFPLSRVDDVGNTMAHLRLRSLPVDFNSLSGKLI